MRSPGVGREIAVDNITLVHSTSAHPQAREHTVFSSRARCDIITRHADIGCTRTAWQRAGNGGPQLFCRSIVIVKNRANFFNTLTNNNNGDMGAIKERPMLLGYNGTREYYPIYRICIEQIEVFDFLLGVVPGIRQKHLVSAGR